MAADKGKKGGTGAKAGAKPAAKKSAAKGTASKPAAGPKSPPAKRAGKTWQDTKAANAAKAAGGKADPKKPAAGKRAGKTQAERSLPRTKPKEIDYTSPEFLSAYDTETAEVSGQQVRRIYDLQTEWQRLHEEAAAKKKEFEAARTAHLNYVRQRIDQRGKKPAETGNLFQNVEAEETLKKYGPAANASGAAAVAGGGPQQLPQTGSAAGWYPDDLWKQFPIDRYTAWGLTAADVEKLKAGVVKGRPEPFPIETVGDLNRYTTPSEGGHSLRLTDIKGIGEAAAERLLKADSAFWGEWPGLSAAFAVEKGYHRPDPLAPSADFPDPVKVADGAAVVDGANRTHVIPPTAEAAAGDAEPAPLPAKPSSATAETGSQPANGRKRARGKKADQGATDADAGGGEVVGGSAGGDRPPGDDDGDRVSGVPGADYRHPSAYIPDPAEANGTAGADGKARAG